MGLGGKRERLRVFECTLRPVPVVRDPAARSGRASAPFLRHARRAWGITADAGAVENFRGGSRGLWCCSQSSLRSNRAGARELAGAVADVAGPWTESHRFGGI